MRGNVLLFAPMARLCSYYLLDDDFLWGDASTLWPGVLLEVAWATFRPGALHAIELPDGRVIFRHVHTVIFSARGLALEISGGDESGRELLPLVFVRRTGKVRRVFYVQGALARELPEHAVLKKVWATG
jgi:hypothetical protein